MLNIIHFSNTFLRDAMVFHCFFSSFKLGTGCGCDEQPEKNNGYGCHGVMGCHGCQVHAAAQHHQRCFEDLAFCVH